MKKYSVLFCIELRNTEAWLKHFQFVFFFFAVGPWERHVVRHQIVITRKMELGMPGFSKLMM